MLQLLGVLKAADQTTRRLKVGKKGLSVQSDRGQQIDLPGLRVPSHSQAVRVGCVRHLRASLPKLSRRGRRYYKWQNFFVGVTPFCGSPYLGAMGCGLRTPHRDEGVAPTEGE